MLKMRSLAVALVLHASGVALADQTQPVAVNPPSQPNDAAAPSPSGAAIAAKGGLELAKTPALAASSNSSTFGASRTQQYPPCTSEPEPASIQAARGAFEAGKAAFEEGDYDRAITYWEDAYRRDCTAHAMLKNLARAYELNVQHERAIYALKTYLRRTPDAPEEEALQRRIANLREKQATVEAMRRAAAQARAAAAHTTASTPRRFPEKTTGPADVAAEPTSGRSPWPFIVAGGGLVLTGLGTVQWVRAHSDAKDAARDCVGDRKNCGNQEAVERGNRAVQRERIWGAVTGVGIATMAGGVLWYVLQPDADSRAELTPSVAPDYAGLRWSGRF